MFLKISPLRVKTINFSIVIWFVPVQRPRHKKPCHVWAEPDVAGYKVVADSFSENEEVAMLLVENGGGKICPPATVLYVFLSSVMCRWLAFDMQRYEL